MKIIKQALHFAKLQRTDKTEQQIIDSYKKDYENIDNNIRPVMKPIENILDIGCGIAGWECFLPEYSNSNIYLIDKSLLDEYVFYGYASHTAFYTSLKIAKENLIENGINKENIFMQEATDKNEILFDVKFDLIVSFLSCGFHYPVETYLNKIYEKLRKGGILIIDIRKGTEGINKLKEKFGNCEIIMDEEKHERVKCIK